MQLANLAGVLPGGCTVDLAYVICYNLRWPRRCYYFVLEVDQEVTLPTGLLQWTEQMDNGMRAMDLLVGAKKVICTLQHTDKGNSNP